MKYGFYSKEDETKEFITKASYTSKRQAERDFAFKKDMDVDTFLKLYEVVQIQ
jgi:hypothetical protein